MIAYRADIDGLRAVAVGAVVVNHAFPETLTGGFVGVDVFFVISGFLITRILLAERHAGAGIGGLSLGRFYERRVRRIFPALFAMFAATLVAGYLLLLPSELEDLGRGVLYATLFASNVLLNREVGYFDPAAEDNPLLHTWSLGVEEQFYLAFPVMLWLLQRYAARFTVHVLAALSVASLGAAIFYVERHPTAVFYLPHFRAWELLVGSLLALGAVPAIASRVAREALAWAGLAAIAVPCVLYDDTTTFPGATALAPCLGSAALIHVGATGGSSGGALLSTRPFVLLGLISYSLYLWHWPLLVLGHLYAIRPLTALEIIGLVLVSIAISTASYRFIEQPARRVSVRSRSALMWSAGAVMALFAALGFGLAYTDGLPGRYARELEVISRGAHSRTLRSGVCDGPHAASSDDLVACSMGGEALGPPSFAFWGDSHARVIAPAMATAAQASGRRGMLFTSTGCPPSYGELARRGSRTSSPFDCPAAATEVAGMIAQNASVRDVFLVARWAIYVEGTRYGSERGDGVRLSDRRSPDGADGNAAIFERSLDALLASFSSAKQRVWLLSPVPEVGVDVPSTLLRMAITGRDLQLAPKRSDVAARQRRSLALLERLAAKHRATLLRIDAPFCAGERCRIVQDDGVPLYGDDDHVSVYGAALIAPLLTEALRKP